MLQGKKTLQHYLRLAVTKAAVQLDGADVQGVW